MKKIAKILSVGVPVLLVFGLGFNNCGRFGGGIDGGTGLDGYVNLSSNAPPKEGSAVDSQALGLPYALLSAEQILFTMTEVTNTTALSGRMMEEYNNRYGSFPSGNDVSMANGPMLLGATSLAGEVCNNVVTNEKNQVVAQRAFFGSIDFTKGISSVDDSSFSTAVRGMARSFWGRNETSEELNMAMGFKTEFLGNIAAGSRNDPNTTSGLMMSTCAAMLSSVDTMTY